MVLARYSCKKSIINSTWVKPLAICSLEDMRLLAKLDMCMLGLL